MEFCINLYEIECYMICSCDVSSICDVNVIFHIYCVFFYEINMYKSRFYELKKGTILFTTPSLNCRK
jgi:hypothetical protein